LKNGVYTDYPPFILTILSIADKIEFPIWELQKIVDSLIDQEVISVNK